LIIVCLWYNIRFESYRQMSNKGHHPLQTQDGFSQSSTEQTQDPISCPQSAHALVNHFSFDLLARKLTSPWQHTINNSDVYIKQELCLARAACKTHKAEIVLARSRMYEGLLLASIMQKRVQAARSQTSREEGEIQQLCADLRNRGIADEVDTQTMGPKELRDLFTDTEVRNFVSALDMTWVGEDEWSDSDVDCDEDQCDGASWIRRGEGSLPN
jgi:hypothetical protein